VINGVKESLKQINHVSRQLLSRIQDVQNGIQEKSQTQPDSSSDTRLTDNKLPDNELTDSELTGLASNRQNLITHLFEHNLLEEIKAQLPLLNEMTSLDAELSIKSQACKHALAEQVMKLKKSKKMAHSYKKY
tara:strand:+ start:6192 stop:6590 length:399 start_codon:yes stop_codon:yes gene_type:complete